MQGDEEEALSASDAFDLPNDAWLDPHSYREGYTARGVPRGVPEARLDSSSSEDHHRQRGAAAGAPARPTWETKRGSHGYFNVDFLESLKAFCEEHKPLRIAILSYCSPTNAAWYQHHFLEEALFCFREALPSSTNLSIGQTFQRTGPDGKAQQLSKIVPPASLIIDDNNGIVKECRKTGALVIHASKGGGADQPIFELGQASPLIKKTGRNNLPHARRLEPVELLYER